jgi:hypothetical protein
VDDEQSRLTMVVTGMDCDGSANNEPGVLGARVIFLGKPVSASSAILEVKQ